MKQKLEDILPPFPHAIRLPSNPVFEWADLLSRDQTIGILQDPSVDICAEEKVDGSSVGMCLHNEHPKMRNKEHMLRKGDITDKPAKKQFSNIWNWFYDNHRKFRKVEDAVGLCSVYGEWMWMQHGLEYDKLPSWFIAFDIFIHRDQQFLTHLISRGVLQEAGFTIPKRLDYKRAETFEDYVNFAEGPSQFTTKGEREGVCIKVSKGNHITHRFKLVRPGFVRGVLFKDKVVKNKLAKSK